MTIPGKPGEMLKIWLSVVGFATIGILSAMLVITSAATWLSGDDVHWYNYLEALGQGMLGIGIMAALIIYVLSREFDSGADKSSSR